MAATTRNGQTMPEIVDLLLHVTGMDCGHCASRIDKVLERALGVQHSRSDFSCGQVRVRFDAGIVTAVDLVNRVEQAGFSVTRVEHPDAP